MNANIKIITLLKKFNITKSSMTIKKWSQNINKQNMIKLLRGRKEKTTI